MESGFVAAFKKNFVASQFRCKGSELVNDLIVVFLLLPFITIPCKMVTKIM